MPARLLQHRAVEIAGREQAPDLIVDLGQLQFVDLHKSYSINRKDGLLRACAGKERGGKRVFRKNGARLR